MDILQQLDERYPASKRSIIFENMHGSQNWFTIEKDGWHLPATKEKHDWCGEWSYRGCLNVNGHIGTECQNKAFIKTYQRSCYRADCETCWKKWLARESNKATQRIEKYQDQSKKHVKHIILSVPKWLYGKDKKELSKIARSILKKVNCEGSAMIYHPFRYNKDYRQWYFSPHFHCMGFGWINAVAETYNKDGWIVKNKGQRESIFATFYYILSHAGIKKRNHSLVWVGEVSYVKLKIEKEEKELEKCPYCDNELHEVYFVGEFGHKPPDLDCEVFDDLENWSIIKNCEYTESTYDFHNVSFINEIISQIA